MTQPTNEHVEEVLAEFTASLNTKDKRRMLMLQSTPILDPIMSGLAELSARLQSEAEVMSKKHDENPDDVDMMEVMRTAFKAEGVNLAGTLAVEILQNFVNVTDDDLKEFRDEQKAEASTSGTD